MVLGGQKPILQMLDSSCPLKSINNGMETGERMDWLFYDRLALDWFSQAQQDVFPSGKVLSTYDITGEDGVVEEILEAPCNAIRDEFVAGRMSGGIHVSVEDFKRRLDLGHKVGKYLACPATSKRVDLRWQQLVDVGENAGDELEFRGHYRGIRRLNAVERGSSKHATSLMRCSK